MAANSGEFRVTRFTHWVPHAPESVSGSRRRLRDDLIAAGLDDGVVDDAIVVFSELIGNAVRHALPLVDGVNVGWATDGRCVVVEVADGGRKDGTGPVPRISASENLTGRGLWLVDELSYGWGVIGGETGRTVWAVLCDDSVPPATVALTQPPFRVLQ